jgi:hypothetical protein
LLAAPVTPNPRRSTPDALASPGRAFFIAIGIWTLVIN